LCYGNSQSRLDNASVTLRINPCIFTLQEHAREWRLDGILVKYSRDVATLRCPSETLFFGRETRTFSAFDRMICSISDSFGRSASWKRRFDTGATRCAMRDVQGHTQFIMQLEPRMVALGFMAGRESVRGGGRLDWWKKRRRQR